MTCPKCRQAIPDGASVCPSCSSPLFDKPPLEFSEEERRRILARFWMALVVGPVVASLIIPLAILSIPFVLGIALCLLVSAVVAGFYMAKLVASSGVGRFFAGILISIGALVVYVAIIATGCAIIGPLSPR